MNPKHSHNTFKIGFLGVLISLMLMVSACRGEPELIGTDMEEQQAPPFTLVDQRGELFRLSEMQGKAIAMTFIFTNCPDVCPLIVNRMKMAYDELPEDKQENVAMVAVTVDPERDSIEAMAEYFETRGVGGLDNWYGLTGDLESLEEIWEAYYVTPGERYPADPEVAAAIEEGEHDHEEFIEEGLEGSDDHDQEHDDHAVEEDENTAYWLAHTDVIYVIDTEGKVRVLMRSGDSPEDLAHNLEILAP